VIRKNKLSLSVIGNETVLNRESMTKLTGLINVGKELEKQLNSAGIRSKADLENTGTMEAWLKIQKIDSSACINRLIALECAIQGVSRYGLSRKDKDKLKDFYQKNRIKLPIMIMNCNK
jgi:DNA transformation protein